MTFFKVILAYKKLALVNNSWRTEPKSFWIPHPTPLVDWLISPLQLLSALFQVSLVLMLMILCVKGRVVDSTDRRKVWWVKHQIVLDFPNCQACQEPTIADAFSWPFSFIKGATSRLTHLEMFSLNFSSSSFVIRINRLHPRPSLFRYGLLLSLWCVS